MNTLPPIVARPMWVYRLLLALTLAWATLAAPPVFAQEFNPMEDAVGPDGLNGEDIYARVLENRFDAFVQRLTLSSKDRAGHRQLSEIEVKYLKNVAPDAPVVSRSLAKYFQPLDIRHLGYLVINKRRGIDDQFVYRPSSRQVRRINARSESISGTDFALQDVIPAELEDGRYYRMPDTEYKGMPAWVVTAVPNEDTDSEYSKLEITIEKERGIPLRTAYWDDRGVEIKQLRVDPKSFERFDAEENGQPKHIWVARRSKMVHLKRESQTVLNIVSLESNPELSDRDFSQRKLTSSH